MNSTDLYCERLGPAFWAEPVNALTNISFLVAAGAAWHLCRRSNALSPGAEALIATAVAIGIGSFLFHTFATGWARVLDVVPILIFQLLFLWLYGRGVIALSRTASALSLAGFLVAAFLGRRFPGVLNGSLIYAPALLTLLALGIYHARSATKGRLDLLAAAGVLAVSLFFRTIDNLVCPALPLGTHFIWHLANGAVVYLAIRALVLQQRT